MVIFAHFEKKNYLALSVIGTVVASECLII